MTGIFSTHQFSEQDIPDQTGRVALITGGTSGLGLQSAMTLYKKNATVFITARDVKTKGALFDEKMKARLRSPILIQKLCNSSRYAM